ncbi:MAG: hypothetical protein F4056_06340 [Chloroflexi bacterium]|nr:hypothetical protein [Chloroflexota bacterium]
MPALSCYRLKPQVEGTDLPDFDDYVSTEIDLITSGPVVYPDFEAKLYYSSSPPRQPSWGSFLDAGFEAPIDWPYGQSTSALVIARFGTRGRHHYFAFPFGPIGRFFLRDDTYHRVYGLRTALNLMYPIGAVPGSGQGLRTIDSKRRGATLVRSRSQSSAITTVDVFDIDRLRDVVNGVDGRPADTDTWGSRVAGRDAFSLNLETDFASLGRLCRSIDEAAGRRDYQAQFAWLDHIQPVNDPTLIERLRERVVELIRLDEGELDLAPPEIVDWSLIHRFEFPFDRRRGIRHPDLRLADLRSILKREGKLDELEYRGLHDRRLRVLDIDGQATFRWTLWSCLAGEFDLDGRTYIIDESDFFEVDENYLSSLNQWVDRLETSTLVLPDWDRRDSEGTYNEKAADKDGHLLLDKRTIQLPGATAVELCDLLSTERQLVHVKRNSGSSDLSHLFSQGAVSATALQEDEEFRALAAQRVSEMDDGDEYGLFAEPLDDLGNRGGLCDHGCTLDRRGQ